MTINRNALRIVVGRYELGNLICMNDLKMYDVGFMYDLKMYDVRFMYDLKMYDVRFMR